MLTLNAPTKNASKMLSVEGSTENNYLMLMTNLSIEANSVDPYQTASIGAV